MTEPEWFNCNDTRRMLDFLADKASDRKVRLWAVAFCRSMWHRLTDERSRKAVALAEQFADGSISEKELAHARKAAYAVPFLEMTPFNIDGRSSAWNAARPAIREGARLLTHVIGSAKVQSGLFREIMGNPFKPVSLKLAGLSHSVISLARSIYDEQTFDLLPILADALEEAGCTNADILAHLRSDGPHVRGCWALDLVLGKE